MDPKIKANLVIDTENAICPIPIIRINESMHKLQVDQILKAVTRDSTVKTDIASWAKRTGNEVLKIEDNKTRYIFYIRKGVNKPNSKIDEDIQMSFKQVRHLRFFLNEDNPRRVESNVSLEVPIRLKVNKSDLITLLCTPTHLSELAIGYLLDEGIVDSIEQIKKVSIDGIEIEVKADIDISKRATKKDRTYISSECVSVDHYLALNNVDNLKQVDTDFKISMSELVKIVKEFNMKKHSDQTGGIHSAALFENTVLKHSILDVSRHCAVDKVIGASAKDNIDFSHSVIVTSGRQPANIILKAARLNIPVSVSMRGPIYSGIIAAEKTRVTLIAYASSNKMDVYSNPERIDSK